MGMRRRNLLVFRRARRGRIGVRAPIPARNTRSFASRARASLDRPFLRGTHVAEYTREAESRDLLNYFLRDTPGLTGTHVGCDTSQCGACTVLLDGQAIKSCTVYSAGLCTPGMIWTLRQLLDENPA